MKLKPGEIVLASISQLYLCADLDCGAVSNVSDQCPVCASHVLSLASLLNRHKTAQPQPEG